jgi:hypothetical protein
MFASIRCYFVHQGSVPDLARRVDGDFADLIAAQPGFVAYAFVDCDNREYITISVFRQGDEAEASRHLARRWGNEHMADFELTVTAALHVRVVVNRATVDVLAPVPGEAPRFARARSYRLGDRSVSRLMRIADEVFAERIQALRGFLAYHVFDCADGDVVTVGLFGDQTTAERADELADEFVRDELESFEIDRTEMIGSGKVLVSRATPGLLAPAP